jgi:hypothetical protein
MRLSYLRCCPISAGPSPFAWDADEPRFCSFADFRRVTLLFNVRREWDLMMPVMRILWCVHFQGFRQHLLYHMHYRLNYREDLSRWVTDFLVFSHLIYPLNLSPKLGW